MTNAIVQINFSFTVSKAELEAGSIAAADMFAGLSGLSWKIWLVNEETKTAGGIYLFESMEQAQDYASSDIVTGIKTAYEDFVLKVFEVLDAPSVITRAPLR
jgi:hypothetical protein